MAVPRTLAARIESLKLLQLYLANNPLQENGPLKVTSAKSRRSMRRASVAERSYRETGSVGPYRRPARKRRGASLTPVCAPDKSPYLGFVPWVESVCSERSTILFSTPRTPATPHASFAACCR